MKKLTALLLALAILVPTLALAETTAPTFDFTPEEWLERYQALVPEGDPFWIDGFEYAADDRIYAYAAKWAYDGGISIAGKLGSDKLSGIDLYIKDRDFLSYSKSDIYPESFLNLFDAFAKVVLAVNPEFKTVDVDVIFEHLGVDREIWNHEFFTGTYVSEYKGMSYRYDGRSRQRFYFSITADPDYQFE